MKVSNTGRSAPPLFCHRAARIPGRQKILRVCAVHLPSRLASKREARSAAKSYHPRRRGGCACLFEPRPHASRPERQVLRRSPRRRRVAVGASAARGGRNLSRARALARGRSCGKLPTRTDLFGVGDGRARRRSRRHPRAHNYEHTTSIGRAWTNFVID